MGENKQRSQIQDFFSEKSVFITGSTGFLGSVLLEKLLRCCPEINKFYLLIREKKGMDAQERIKKIFNSKLFSKIQTERIIDKIVLVNGEMTLPGLGLSEKDRKTLAQEVSVIFHVAATTNFGAHLRRAVSINLQGTEKVLELAHEMKNLQVFVYISTAYCNAVVRGMTTEENYPSWIDSDELIEKISKLTDDEIEKQTESFLGGYPTTYSFTKHMAENLLYKKRQSIPVAVIRPSVVLGTLEEPIPGWVENVQNGGVAFIAGAGKGIFRTVLGDNTTISDIVPCDMVASLSVAAAWDVAKLGVGSFKVYHCTSGIENPITLNDYCNLTIEKVRQFPCSEVLWYPGAKCRIGVLRNYIFVFLFHLLPGYIIAVWEKWNSRNRPMTSVSNSDEVFCSQKPASGLAIYYRMIKLVPRRYVQGEFISFAPDPNGKSGLRKVKVIQYHKKFIRGMGFLHYFTTRNWYFCTRNTRQLAVDLCETDKAMFNFDVKRIYWPTYLEKCVLGVRHFYHGDYPESIEKSRNNIKVLRALHYGFYCLIFTIVFYILTLCGFEFWSSVLGGASAFAFIFWL